MTKDKIQNAVQRARNEINEERMKEGVERLKTLYRQKAETQDVLDSIERKIELEERKVTDQSNV